MPSPFEMYVGAFKDLEVRCKKMKQKISIKNAEIARLREEIKNLNHMLDDAKVLRGEAAERFLERMEAVDRGDIPKSNKQPEIDYERLHAILAEKKKQREASKNQLAPRYDDVFFAGVEALDKL